MSQQPLTMRVYDFLLSNGVACLRDVYEALKENPHRVDDRLRRLWIKGLILRTREPTFEFETCHRGRAGPVGYTRAVNYYVVKGKEIGSQFVAYEDRKKDGRSRGIESKAKKIVNFLKKNRDKAFYSVDVVKALASTHVTLCLTLEGTKRRVYFLLGAINLMSAQSIQVRFHYDLDRSKFT